MRFPRQERATSDALFMCFNSFKLLTWAKPITRPAYLELSINSFITDKKDCQLQENAKGAPGARAAYRGPEVQTGVRHVDRCCVQSNGVGKTTNPPPGALNRDCRGQIFQEPSGENCVTAYFITLGLFSQFRFLVTEVYLFCRDPDFVLGLSQKIVGISYFE